MATPVDPEPTGDPAVSGSNEGSSATQDPRPSDWVSSLVDRFINVVEQVRNVTARPVVTLARALVFGVVMVCCLLAALVLTGIGLFRLLDVALPGDSWSTHLVLGAVCCSLGALLWSRRSP